MKRFLVLAAAAVLLACLLTGCALLEEDEIALVNAPQAEYLMDADANEEATLAKLDFTVRIRRNGTDFVLNYRDNKDLLKVTGFSLATAGTRTATITYEEVNNLSVTFTYTVLGELGTLNGSGTAEDPYEIASAESFLTMVSGGEGKGDGSGYYELVADIDFSTLDAEDLQSYVQTMKDKDFNFTGTLDGNNYTISNLTMPGLDGAEEGEQLQMGLFYKIAPDAGQTATIKNLKFYNCHIYNSSAAGVGILGFGNYPDKSAGYNQDVAAGTVVIDNVDMYSCSVRAMKNSSLYLGYAAGTNFVFRNCDVDANCSVMTTGHSAATFIGSGSYINAEQGPDKVHAKDPSEAVVSFDNCISSAKLIGASNVHGFIGNFSGQENYTATRSNGSRYTGVIYTMVATGASDSAHIIHKELSNNALDSYVVHSITTDTSANGTGYVVSKDITAGTLTYEAGKTMSAPVVNGGVSYIFSYSFARGGSTYGNSATLVSPTGATVSSPEGIRFFDKIYDVAGEAYTNDQKRDPNALCVYGPLNTNIPNVDTMKVTFSITVLDEAGNVVYYASCSPTIAYNPDAAK